MAKLIIWFNVRHGLHKYIKYLQNLFPILWSVNALKDKSNNWVAKEVTEIYSTPSII